MKRVVVRTRSLPRPIIPVLPLEKRIPFFFINRIPTTNFRIPTTITVPPAFQKRQKTRFQLDVGAYGIPKSIGQSDNHRRDDPSLSVQVGEDAYFVNNLAMGVADGVGGWANRAISPLKSSPSALFARRLMHYCSEEVRAVTTPASPLLFNSWPSSSEQSKLQQDLNDSLDELQDGLDVLMILENAYQKTLKDHVRPQTPPLAISSSFSSSSSSSPTPSVSVPLLAGSSTALFAILDHAPRRPSDSPEPLDCPSPPYYDAVIKIAHIGDCMGMLLRGDEIVWRTQEMWWGFNTPVQLGPSSSARPQDAQVFTLPVQADDILILASDGLSDNLWDEDVLDEVVRFRRSFLGPRSDVPGPKSASERLLRRRTLAGMLSEALCSRARRVSERVSRPTQVADIEDEVPFARRAREQGRSFRGGKNDDISVLVAVISPASDITNNCT